MTEKQSKRCIKTKSKTKNEGKAERMDERERGTRIIKERKVNR